MIKKKRVHGLIPRLTEGEEGGGDAGVPERRYLQLLTLV